MRLTYTARASKALRTRNSTRRVKRSYSWEILQQLQYRELKCLKLQATSVSRSLLNRQIVAQQQNKRQAGAKSTRMELVMETAKTDPWLEWGFGLAIMIQGTSVTAIPFIIASTDRPRNISERCPGSQTNNRGELIARSLSSFNGRRI